MAVLIASPATWGAAGPKRQKLMLLDFPADPAFTPNVIRVIGDYLAGGLRDQGFEVMTTGDIGAALGVERQKELMGCSESSCVADIGGAMGVDYIVRPNMAVLDRDTVLTLTLIDSKGRRSLLVRPGPRH
jgi:hypothetical protein